MTTRDSSGPSFATLLGNSVRRVPSQERSAATVEAIASATILVLEAVPPDSLTMIAVADRAGVSIGTLYQYFANRTELLSGVVALRTRAFFELADRILSRPVPLEQRVRESIQELAHAKFEGLRLHAATRELMGEDEIRRIVVAGRSAFSERLEVALREAGVASASQTAEALTHVVETVLHEIRDRSPRVLGDPRVVDGVTEVAMAVLYPDA